MSDMMYQKKLVGKYKMLLYKIWKNAQNMCRTLKIKYRRLLMDEYAKLKTKLQLGKNSNLNYIQEKDIDNIEEINVDINMPKKDRMIGFLKKVKNPYVFMEDGLKVKFEYSDKGLNINQCIENLIMNRTRI